MRALLFPFGSLGDVRPLVAIGAALKKRGHEAILGANPRFKGLAEAAGIEQAPIGTVEAYAAVLDNPDLWHPTRGPKLLHEYTFGSSLQKQAELVAQKADDNTVIIAGTFAVGAWIAGRKRKRPVVRVQGQPAALFGPHDPPVLPSGKRMGGPMWLRRWMLGSLFDATVFRPLGRDLNRARAEFGLPPWPRRFMRSYLDADLNLLLFPEWYAERTPDWPENGKTVGFFVDPPEGPSDLKPDLNTFLDAGDPPVLFTPGPAGYQHGEEFFRVAAEACKVADQRAVFVTRGQKPSLELPQSIQVYDYLPFGSVFPRCAAIVHHGGIGTVAHAIAAGRPQLVVAFGFDQPDNGRRVVDLGVGDLLMTKAMSPKKLGAALQTLLAAKEIREKASALADTMSADKSVPVDTACDLIEGIA